LPKENIPKPKLQAAAMTNEFFLRNEIGLPIKNGPLLIV